MNAAKYYFVFLFMSLLFANCKKEDTGTPGSSNNLVGTWNVTDAFLEDPIIGTLQATTSGTITFRADGTGKESYTYTVSGIPFRESDSFTWISNSDKVIFDGGTVDETIWTRIVNEKDKQQASYLLDESGEDRMITVTLEQ